MAWGLQWWQILQGTNPQGTIDPLVLRNRLSCQWNLLGPLQGAYLALLPTTGCWSLHRRLSRSFPGKKIQLRSGGSNAWVGSGNDGYVFLDRCEGRARVETSTASWALEVGQLVSRGSLRWFSAPLFPEVHGELTSPWTFFYSQKPTC